MSNFCNPGNGWKIDSERFFIGSTILTPNGPLPNGGMLVSEGRIKKISSDFASLTEQYPNIPYLMCGPDTILSPGFINPHDHPAYDSNFPDPNIMKDYSDRDPGYQYFQRDDWRLGLEGKIKLDDPPSYKYPAPELNEKALTTLSVFEIRQLLSGTTTVSGDGAVPGIINSAGDPRNYTEQAYDFHLIPETFPFADYKTGFNATETFSDVCSGKTDVLPELKYENPKNFPTIIAHVGEGEPGKCTVKKEIDAFLGGVNEHSGIRFSMIHGIAADKDNLAKMAKKGISLVMSPRSNLSLYGVTVKLEDVKKASEKGLNIALSTDWTPSGSFNLLEEVRCLKEEMSRQKTVFSDYRLWQFVTKNAAYSLGLENEIGSIENGLRADFFITKYDKEKGVYGSTLDQEITDILGVWVSGKPLVLSPEMNSELDLPCNTIEITNRNGDSKNTNLCMQGQEILDLISFQKIEDENSNPETLGWSGGYEKQASCTARVEIEEYHPQHDDL